MSTASNIHQGGCACGAVRYRVTGAMRPVVACHCSQCRQTYTNYAAFSAARRGDLAIDNEAAVTWFESSPGVRRGFCSRCGSNLFWDRASLPVVGVMAGTVDEPSGLAMSSHMFVAYKGDYYEIVDGLPQKQER